MVIIFCGIPGTGKSTIAKLLVKKLQKKGKVKLIASDEIRNKRYNRIFSWLKENLNKADYLVIDATFYKKKWRDEVKQIADKVFTCYLHCSLETCLRRAEEKNFSPEVVHIIKAKMEKPKQPDISIDTDKIKAEKAAEKIFNQVIKDKS